MSDSAREPGAPTFERARERARQLLRACRSGDGAALARVRAQLPRLAALSLPEAVVRVKLADVQHALAREASLENWAALKHHIEAQEPFLAQVARFLGALPDGDLPVLQRVLEHFPDVAKTSLHAACAACDEALVERWLARDPALATATLGPGAWTPLDCLAASPLCAADRGRAEASARIARRVLALGASPNAFTPQPGSDPVIPLSVLYRASRNGNAALAQVLLEAGADPNDGESTYHAAEFGHLDVLALLQAHGADFSSRHPRWGNTVLYFLSGFLDTNDGAKAANEGLRWLLEHGADPNVTSGVSRETPLQRIADHGREPALAELLLAHGADASLARADGRTALDLAVRAGHAGLAALLRERGAAESRRPDDALLGACARGDRAEAERLGREHPDVLRSLLANTPGVMTRAAAHGNAGAMRAFAALGFDVSREDSHGGTPMHWAAWHGQGAAVSVLLELGAPVDLRDARFGSSPIAWAAHGSANCRSADDDYVAVVDLLLAANPGRAESFNRWNEPPEALASDAVAEHLRACGFAPPESAR